MRAIYDFITEKYWEPTRLWDSCRKECYMVSVILLLCYCDFSNGWNSIVSAIDSCLYGGGGVHHYAYQS